MNFTSSIVIILVLFMHCYLNVWFILLVQLESSGPAFRGLAVQVREATGSTTFSNSDAFVGQFVNAPAGGDWRIWSCDAVSLWSIMISIADELDKIDYLQRVSV